MVIVAVNVPISIPMLHGVSEWQHDECRCVGRFSPNKGTYRYANEDPLFLELPGRSSPAFYTM